MEAVIRKKQPAVKKAFEAVIHAKTPALSVTLEVISLTAIVVQNISGTCFEAESGTAVGPCTKTTSNAQFCTSAGLCTLHA